MPSHHLPRRTVSLGALLAVAVTAASCGGGGGAPGGPDARPSVADAGPSADAAPPANALKVHYHRALGDYSGWTVATSAGAVTAGTSDGFGAAYSVAFAPGAPSVTLSLKNGGQSDGAGDLTVDVSGSVREAWVLSGWPEAITRALPALPRTNQIAVYYLRADDAYSGWGLHLWGDQVTGTSWGAPLAQAGVDPGFGAGFLIDVTPGAAAGNCPPGDVCLIAHKGDTKDPGPDMSFDPKLLGNIIFLLSGSTDLTAVPRRIGDVGIAGAAAHLVAHDTLAWCLGRDANGACVGDSTLTAFELRTSATAEIVAKGTDVTGGTVIVLTPRPSGLTPDQAKLAPYLAGAQVFAIAPADQAKLTDAVKGQLVAVARKTDGKAGRATQVQTALYLDESFATDAPLGPSFAPGGAPTLALWAPTAQSVKLHVYDAAKNEIAGSPFAMTAGAKGVWQKTGDASWSGDFYRFELVVYHPLTRKIETLTVTDPYSVSLSTNSRYSQIIDLADPALKPPGWDGLVKPPLAAPEDIVVYEGHVRDFSALDPTTARERRGKLLGFVTPGGAQPSAGLAHLAELAQAGLTHLHLLPVFDFATIDEDPAQRVDLSDSFTALCARVPAVPADLCGVAAQAIVDFLGTLTGASMQQQQVAGYLRGVDSYNWGYDPLHYGVPEGSYASTAEGPARILELRSAVASLAGLNLRVVFDVVYNHTNASGVGPNSVLDKVVPGYYHRLDRDTGLVQTSSCCQNTASEHRMMERLMIDTLVRWARDYKVDAFRFDLMGLHMRDNLVHAQAALAALTPGHDGVDGSAIYLYGEGWEMGELSGNVRGVPATQANMAGTGVGTFNDRVRDGVRGGGPFDHGDDLRKNQGFASGLYTDPNELSSASDATKERVLFDADLVKTALAGGIADFRFISSTGATLVAAALGYGGKAAGYTKDPQETINYVAAHDNQDLSDILALKLPTGTTPDARRRADSLALDVVLLAQGVPFVHMGDDILRSKSEDGNSYDSGDWFNTVDFSLQSTRWAAGLPPQGDNGGSWSTIQKIFADPTAAPTVATIRDARDHFLEMLQIRKSSPLFRLRTGADVRARVDFPIGGPDAPPGVIVMTIADGACAGPDLDPQRDGLIVVINASPSLQKVTVAGAAGAALHPVQQASADPILASVTVVGSELGVPGRTTAVFSVPQSQARDGGPPCNTR
jgi:pullulanase-type alpha-1,6-glucosidase